MKMAADSSVTSGDSLVVVTESLAGAMLPGWQAMLSRVLDTRPDRLIIDLSSAPTIDADGITALLDIHRRLVSHGGQLIVRSPNARIRRLFQLARVDGVLALETEARP
jgi:anti-anti-sigma factor